MTQRKYDWRQTWKENLDDAPVLGAQPVAVSPVPGSWSWCGLPIASPLGIPAGPLLDSKWLLYYAHLGFDWLVYKTVRTTERDCYPVPNLVPVDVNSLSRPGNLLSTTESMRESWAVSFGMPSQAPSVWRADVAAARKHLPAGKTLIVSVVGTQDNSIQDSQASLDQVAEDYALAARWAVESGAHSVEANFSCPNVSTADGQLYQQPQAASLVAARIREAIPSTPLVLKIGHVADRESAVALIQAVTPYVDGLAMTNSISARVQASSGELLFDGQQRGICGAAIRAASVAQVAMFCELIHEQGLDLDVIGIGGVFETSNVKDYLSAGASLVGMATAAMLQPDVGLRIRREWT